MNTNVVLQARLDVLDAHAAWTPEHVWQAIVWRWLALREEVR